MSGNAKAFAGLADWEQRCILRFGFYIHYMFDDETTWGNVNVHTHNFPEAWGHPDFQIVVPMPQATARGILENLADRVREGDRFEAGKRYSGIIRNLDVLMIEATESGRPVLRVILPTEDGCLDRETIRAPWNKQWPDA